MKKKSLERLDEMYFALQEQALTINEYRKFHDVIPVENYLSMLDTFITIVDCYRCSEEMNEEHYKRLDKIFGIKEVD